MTPKPSTSSHLITHIFPPLTLSPETFLLKLVSKSPNLSKKTINTIARPRLRIHWSKDWWVQKRFRSGYHWDCLIDEIKLGVLILRFNPWVLLMKIVGILCYYVGMNLLYSKCLMICFNEYVDAEFIGVI